MENLTPITLAALYSELNKEELEDAEANLRRYLAVLLRMAERLEAEGKSIHDMAVDCPFDDAAKPL